jgi:prepilin-type N-terminal cleavage/methylation domain-containing protein
MRERKVAKEGGIRANAGVRGRRGGFTLLEMLSVIAVIGILMALLFPILGKMQAHARDTEGTDLCSQVAEAWQAIRVQNGRYPSKELLDAYISRKVSDTGEDLGFRMDVKISSVLNWWTPAPVSKADLRLFNKEHGNDINQRDVERWPPDTVLERTYEQKTLGVYAPWAKKALLASIKREGSLQNAKIPEDSIVNVVIDLNGDGRVTIPSAIAQKIGRPEDRELPFSAVAWVQNGEGSLSDRSVKILKSW